MPVTPNKANWGKPLVEIGLTGTADAAATTFTAITPIEENSAVLESTPGTALELFGEGHALVQRKSTIANYVFKCAVFVLSGGSKPIADSDGVISSDYSVRLTPEDATLTGFIMRKCAVEVKETWSSAKGKMLEYTFTALKPSSGSMLEDYTKP
ncbi:MAG: hypothetical protein NTZ69_16045 [Bacteroidia bacterium]|nr:hypothetical protein [Bacteroidia bacterium]